MSGDAVPVGSWVAIQRTLLEPGQRAAGLPEDTANVPLVMRVRGHLLELPGRIGQEVQIRTLADRVVSGVLVDASPSHDHGFGRTDPAVLRIGQSLRHRGGSHHV